MSKNLIIKNAGFMWHRKYINWQKGAELFGVSEKKYSEPVNFADQAAIYSLYDHNYKCLYIGQAGSGETRGLYHRLKDHLNDYLFCMWERFSWYGFYSERSLTNNDFKDEFKVTSDVNQLLNVIEAISIHTHFPLLNRSMGSGVTDIKWYYQPEEYDEQEIFLCRLEEDKKKYNLI